LGLNFRKIFTIFRRRSQPCTRNRIDAQMFVAQTALTSLHVSESGERSRPSAICHTCTFPGHAGDCARCRGMVQIGE
jgi:hypothetical protein